MRKENIRRKKGTTDIVYDLVEIGLRKENIVIEIEHLHSTIDRAKESIKLLQEELDIINALEVENKEAVDYTINRIQEEVDIEIIEEELVKEPWNISENNTKKIIKDAEEILAEKI